MSTGTSTTSSRFVFRGNAIPIGGRVLRMRDDKTPFNLQSPPASALTVSAAIVMPLPPARYFGTFFPGGSVWPKARASKARTGRT